MNILIIDDDPAILTTANLVLKKNFPSISLSENPWAIYNNMEKGQYDILLLDMNFRPGDQSGKEGIEWLKKFRKKDNELVIISVTAYGDIDLAVKAMKAGAYDFIGKPWDNARILTSVINAAELKSSRDAIKRLGKRQKYVFTHSRNSADILGKSTAMREIVSMIKKVAPTEANILILGENGTGKELLAREIHRYSERADSVFVPVDLGSITESLFESELFGHVKGAFTDAKSGRSGWFEMAEEGTLFLDEIANIPLQLQQKLLAVLQNRNFTPVGGKRTMELNIRLISATNADLYNHIKKGLFREDLFYRINTVEIILPPLRDRREDIPEIAEYYLKIYAQKYKKNIRRISGPALKKLLHYSWPGNVRELIHVIERAVILSDEYTLTSHDFPLKELVNSKPSSVNINELEKEAIQRALRKHRYNLSKAAVELGMGRSTLYRKIKKYGI